MTDLVASLLAWAVLLTGAPRPATAPAVVKLPHAALEAMACARPCQVLGLYTYGEVVYLDDRLDPEADLSARAILLHELVHYLQQQGGTYARVPTCAQTVAREREAYRVQAEYLLRHAALPRAGSTLHGTACQERGLQATAPEPAFVYDATVVRVIDGDTLVADVTLPMIHLHGVTVRLLGVNAPELHDADPVTRARAQAARAFVQAAVLGQPVRIQTTALPGQPGTLDSFRRWLAHLWYVRDGVWRDLGTDLLAADLAAARP